MLSQQRLKEVLELSLAEVEGLTVRTVNTLENNGVYTVEQLLQCCGHPTPECDGCKHFVDERRTCTVSKKLLDIDSLGEKTLEEIYAALALLGLYREPDHPTLNRPEKRKYRGRRA